MRLTLILLAVAMAMSSSCRKDNKKKSKNPETTPPTAEIEEPRNWRATKAACKINPPEALPQLDVKVTGWQIMPIDPADTTEAKIKHVSGLVGQGLLAVGSTGRLVFHNSADSLQLGLSETNTSEDLNFILANIGANFDAVIVGDRGTILVRSYLTGTVRAFEVNPFADDAVENRPDLVGAFGDALNDFYILGSKGEFYHYRVPLSTDPDYTAGQEPKWIVRTGPSVNGGDPDPISGLFAGANNRNVYVVYGPKTAKWDGSTWTELSRADGANSTLKGPFGLAELNVFFTGVGPEIYQLKGGTELSSFANSGLPTFETCYSLHAISESNLFAGCDEGKLYQFDGTAWRADLNAGTPGMPISHLWSGGPDKSNIYSYDGTNFRRYQVHPHLVGEAISFLGRETSSATIRARQDSTGLIELRTFQRPALGGSANQLVRHPLPGSSDQGATIEIGDTLTPVDLAISPTGVYGVLFADNQDGKASIRVQTFDRSFTKLTDFSYQEPGVNLRAKRLSLVSDGSVYVAGTTDGDVLGRPFNRSDVAPSPEDADTAFPTSVDAFLIKFDPNGTPTWAAVLGGADAPSRFKPGESVGALHATDDAVALAGSTYTFPGIAPTSSEPNGNGQFMFLALFTPAGENTNTIGLGGANFDNVRELASGEAEGDWYLLGTSRATTVGDETRSGLVGAGALVYRISATGDIKWHRFLGSHVEVGPLTLTLTPEQDAIFIGGTTYDAYGGQTYLSNGDAFITKILASGQIFGSIVYGGYEGTEQTVGLATIDGSKLYALLSAESRLNGATLPAIGRDYALWQAGEVTLDEFADCRH